ncbi:hypothetical protein JTB14_026331 [Gonioctena quinquepunctata]|nr:hypothetical protein JTB14_026331 [Gonioctena quinquepunctata]
MNRKPWNIVFNFDGLSHQQNVQVGDVVAMVILDVLEGQQHNSHSVVVIEALLYSYGLNQIEPVPESFDIVDSFETTPDSNKYMILDTFNGKLQRFEVDSGAKFPLMAGNDFKCLNSNVPFEPSTIVFRSYSGNIIETKGKISVTVGYHDEQIIGELHIVPWVMMPYWVVNG